MITNWILDDNVPLLHLSQESGKDMIVTTNPKVFPNLDNVYFIYDTHIAAYLQAVHSTIELLFQMTNDDWLDYLLINTSVLFPQKG